MLCNTYIIKFARMRIAVHESFRLMQYKYLKTPNERIASDPFWNSMQYISQIQVVTDYIKGREVVLFLFNICATLIVLHIMTSSHGYKEVL